MLYMTLRTGSYTQVAAQNSHVEELNKKWNRNDYLFYDHFNKRLSEQILLEGDNFGAEVQWLQESMDHTRSFCSSICQRMGDLIHAEADRSELRQLLTEKTTFAASTWDPAFELSGYECLLMMLDPKIFRQAQRVRQYPGLCQGREIRGVAPVPGYWCEDTFAHTFVWGLLYNSTSRRTFLHKCF